MQHHAKVQAVSQFFFMAVVPPLNATMDWNADTLWGSGRLMEGQGYGSKLSYKELKNQEAADANVRESALMNAWQMQQGAVYLQTGSSLQMECSWWISFQETCAVEAVWRFVSEWSKYAVWLLHRAENKVVWPWPPGDLAECPDWSHNSHGFCVTGAASSGCCH